MIPEDLRMIFNDSPASFTRLVEHKNDLCAEFVDANGEAFVIRRENLYGCPADDSTKSGDPQIQEARDRIGSLLRSEFQKQLIRTDLAQILHAQRLQSDIVRLTFHTFGHTPVKTAFGFVILTKEIPTILEKTMPQMMVAHQHMPIITGIPIAMNHNMDILAYFCDSRGNPPPKFLKPFISAIFE